MARRKVAVLGGGLAGVTAAYELAKRGQHDITLYQMGWRLGGKGASGRGANGRIEEHGLHIWFGFYENAFRLMRECYSELGRPSTAPLASLEDAFHPSLTLTQNEPNPLAFLTPEKQWLTFTFPTPVNAGGPGVGDPYPHLSDYLLCILQFIKANVRVVLGELSDPKTIAESLAGSALKLAQGVFDGSSDGGLSETLEEIGRLLGRPLEDVTEADCAALQSALKKIVGLLPSTPGSRGAVALIDTAQAVLVGLLKDRVFTRGFDALDDMEFRDWLIKHGLEPESLDSPFLRATYDTVFGFRHGDPDKPTMAAGTALRSGLRMMFGYKGAFMYTMQAGMGDVVFTPMYELLKRKGVKVQFFHRVDALRLSADKRRISRIDMTRQVDLAPGLSEYDPLVDVKGLPCWPAAPRYEQLAQGAQLQEMAAAGRNVNLESFWCEWNGGTALTLHDGTDYDAVVLAIPVAAFPYLCKELIEDGDNKRRPTDSASKWALMVEKVESIRTMGSQVWVDKSLEELGWEKGTLMMSAFRRPLSTYADLSHLIAVEDFPAESSPKQLAYFCGPMKDDPAEPRNDAANAVYPNSQTRIVAEETRALLERDMPSVWPNFQMEDLNGKPGSGAEERLAAQFYRANIDPSERYVLSVPGSTEYRLHADESGYDNLILAGDWTYNGIHAGCVEATVMSGLQAARALGCEGIEVVGEKDGELPMSFGLRGR